MTEIKNDTKSRTWFCVLNNPQNYTEFEGCETPDDYCKRAGDMWISDSVCKSCAIRYCIKDDLIHLHMVLEKESQARFSEIKKTFPYAHIEATMGNKNQVMDYINKVGQFEEKGEEVLGKYDFGDVKGRQGRSRIYDQIQALLDTGLSPDEVIHELGFIAQQYYDDMVAYYMSLKQIAVPAQHPVKVVYHYGESGTGKSYFCHTKLIDEHRKGDVYFAPMEHSFDDYQCESVLVLDDLRDDFKWNYFLKILDSYKLRLPCRYKNKVACWYEVHITSVLSPQELYDLLVPVERQNSEPFKQLSRRISEVWIHKGIGFDPIIMSHDEYFKDGFIPYEGGF